jgi:hypothetical protein
MKYMGCKQCNKKMKIFKWQYIQNFFRFLIANVKSGFKQVSYSEYEMRRAICSMMLQQTDASLVVVGFTIRLDGSQKIVHKIFGNKK